VKLGVPRMHVNIPGNNKYLIIAKASVTTFNLV